MRQRGRKSAAALRLVHSDDDPRPEGPDSLTREQRELWDSIIRAVPKDWFSAENMPLLEQYCVLIDRTRAVNKKLNGEKIGTNIYFRLLSLEHKFTRHLAMLATKMRIAQQSTYDKSRRKGAKDLRPAWDADDEIPQDEED